MSAALALSVGCTDSGQQLRTHEAQDSVIVVFTRNETPVPVSRPVSGAPDLRAALTWLVAGPARTERAAGIQSWFSAGTAGVLKDVHVDSSGHATIDFQDLRPLIPGASSSAGSAMLLHELNGTVFQFPQIRSVEYRIDGSCEVFWEWLQYGCRTVERTGG